MALQRKPTSYSFTPKTLESIKELAERQETTKTAAITRAIREALEREKKKITNSSD